LADSLDPFRDISITLRYSLVISLRPGPMPIALFPDD